MVDKTDPLIAKYGTGRHGHSHFAPSAASGWLNCPGYLLANAVSSDSAGEEAAYGTVAHAIAQAWLQTGTKPVDRLDTVQAVGPHRILIDAAMLAAIGRYVAWCQEVPGDHYIEQRLDLSAVLPIPEQYGTADHFACSPGVLVITDLKMGTGVKVAVEDNPQAMLYALGAFQEWDWVYGFRRVILRICQPRLDYFGVWELKRDDLIKFGQYVQKRALLAWDEAAPRIPSEAACRWCAARTRCPAVSLHLESLADDSFAPEGDVYYSAPAMEAHAQATPEAPPTLPGDPRALSIEMLAYRLEYRRLYEKWFRAIYDELLARAERGETVPGWKLARGRRSYAWRDVDDAVDAMVQIGLEGEQLYTTEVISVARARTALKTLGLAPAAIEQAMAAITDVKPGRPTLVPDRDDRADLHDDMDDLFGREGDP